MSASRAAEAIGTRSSRIAILESYNGPAAYASGGTTFSSLLLNTIERAVAIPPTTSGITPAVVTGSVTGNTFKVQFFAAGTGSGLNGAEVASGSNLGSQGFYVLEEGVTV